MIDESERWRIADALMSEMVSRKEGPLTSKQIADRIGVTHYTIEQLQKRALAKLRRRCVLVGIEDFIKPGV